MTANGVTWPGPAETPPQEPAPKSQWPGWLLFVGGLATCCAAAWEVTHGDGITCWSFALACAGFLMIACADS